MEAILKEYHAQLVAQNRESHNTDGTADPAQSPQQLQNRSKKKMKSREKIEKLVSDGAKNYPAYLKLVHTGDSDFSDDETIERQIRNKKDTKKPDKKDIKADVRVDKEEIIDLGDPLSSLGAASPGDEKKDATKEQRLSEEGKDLMCEEVTTPEYENALNQSTEPVDPEERARLEEEWKCELAKLEDEINTLRQVLSSKVREAGDLKRKLGITAMVEFKQDLRQGFQNIKDSDAYKKTNETVVQLENKIVSSEVYQKTASTLSTAGEKVSANPAYKATNEKLQEMGDKLATTEAYQKTNQALKTVGAKTAGAFSTAGAFASKKLGDMRNSNAFKSFEEKLGGAYSNVKHSRSIGSLRSKMTRVRGSKSENNFEDALRSSSLTEEQNGGSASYPASPMSADEKVPL